MPAARPLQPTSPIRTSHSCCQYAILRKLVDHPGPLTLEALRVDPIYQGLYFRKTEKTRQRDMRHLRDTGLIVVDPNGVLRLGRRHAETASARKPK